MFFFSHHVIAHLSPLLPSSMFHVPIRSSPFPFPHPFPSLLPAFAREVSFFFCVWGVGRELNYPLFLNKFKKSFGYFPCIALHCNTILLFVGFKSFSENTGLSLKAKDPIHFSFCLSPLPYNIPHPRNHHFCGGCDVDMIHRRVYRYFFSWTLICMYVTPYKKKVRNNKNKLFFFVSCVSMSEYILLRFFRLSSLYPIIYTIYKYMYAEQERIDIHLIID